MTGVTNGVKILKVDINNLKMSLSDTTSALKAAAIAEENERNQRIVAEINRQSAKRNATLLAGAEASIEQKELFEQQLEIIQEQNKLLYDNYEKLKEMYDVQVKENKDAANELNKSKRFNAWMMVIAIIAMFAAIAGPIVTLCVN